MNTTDYTNQTIGGKYRIIRLLGEGGMGSVFLGEHIVIGKEVAIKFLRTEFSAKEDVVKRFFREAQVAAAIRHRNIIDIMDVGVSESGEPYLVMEYLEGESLADLLKRAGPLDLSVACAVIEPTLLALAAAHEKGIVHRDLKPENIFIVRHDKAPPTVKLIDLGISKITQEQGQSHLTQTGSFLGTPAYMAPEQIKGAAHATHLADLYSMGVILYEMLTGERPFRGAHYNELLINVMTTSPRPPSEVRPDFPEVAEPIVMQLLEKEPEKRPADASEILQTIQSFPGFENRLQTLDSIVSSAPTTTFAGGTLGEADSNHSREGLASNVLAEMSGQTSPASTPTNWTNTFIPKSKRGNLLVVGLVALVLLVGGVLYGVSRSSSEKPARVASSTKVPTTDPDPQTTPVLSPTKEDHGVEIHVVGQPSGAKIYFEDFLVLQNPFRVKRETTVMKLTVKAEGYETFRVSVIPAEDLKIPASMTPVKKIEPAEPTPAVKPTPAPRKASKKPTRPSHRRHKKSKPFIAEEFE